MKKAEEMKKEVVAVAEEKKAVRTLATIKELLKKLKIKDASIIDVKPAGVGVKVDNTRLCAVYLTRTNNYRIKTNKLAIVDNMRNEYCTSLEYIITSDNRDYNITSIDIDDDMLITFIEELNTKVIEEKEKKAKEKAEVQKAKAEAEAQKKAEKKAQKEVTAKKVTEKKTTTKKVQKTA